MGVVDDEVSWDARIRGRLSIPYLTRAGVVGIRYRCLEQHDCAYACGAKYLGEPGQSTRIYNVGSVLTAERGLAICEGELDAATLFQCGIPAIGIPGAESWKERYKRVVEDAAPFIVFADGDKAGKEFAKQLMKKLSDVRIAQMPKGMDVNSAFLKFGAEYLVEQYERGEED